MEEKLSPAGRGLLLVAALAIGLHHGSFVAEMAFRGHHAEPSSFWVFLLAGPASALPAGLFALFRPRWGAAWLLCGGILSAIALTFYPAPTLARYFLIRYSLPMLALGAMAWILGSPRRRDLPAWLHRGKPR